MQRILLVPEGTLTQLEELSHQLSNTIGQVSGHLMLALTCPHEQLMSKLEIATESAMRATETLRSLMWELATVRRQAAQDVPTIDGHC